MEGQSRQSAGECKSECGMPRAANSQSAVFEGQRESSSADKAAVYLWIEKMLVDQRPAATEKQRGTIRREQGGGWPGAVRTEFRAHRDKRVEAKVYRRQRFAANTPADIACWRKWTAHTGVQAGSNATHPEAEYAEFGQAKFARLAEISVASYNSARCGVPEECAVFEPTRPSPVSIAERRGPIRRAGLPAVVRCTRATGWRRRVSHQRGGHGDTVAGDRMRRQISVQFLSQCWKRCASVSFRLQVFHATTARVHQSRS